MSCKNAGTGSAEQASGEISMQPIGHINTCFTYKNGTPRQATVSCSSKGRLTISKAVFNNPEHSLIDLQQFSYVWILFYFHLNQNKGTKAKVKPPRLNGLKTGVFASRSPHRPNAIGMTLAKLDEVVDDTLHFSGLDIVDGTPVLDLKPYIPDYDSPQTREDRKNSISCDDVDSAHAGICLTSAGMNCAEVQAAQNTVPKTETLNENFGNEDLARALHASTSENHLIKVPEWVKSNYVDFRVSFTDRALQNIQHFKMNCCDVEDDDIAKNWTLNQIGPDDLVKAIEDILLQDPRSTYRKNKCTDKLYYFTLDNVHVTTWFDNLSCPNCFEVLRIVPKGLACHMQDLVQIKKHPVSYKVVLLFSRWS